MDAWHEAHGAHWEPVGDWRRPYTYRRPGESIGDAVTREVLEHPQRRRPARRLDPRQDPREGPRRRTVPRPALHQRHSSLPVGRCRYGLMCNENGFLFDDGVVVRLARTASSATPPPAARTGCTPGWRSGCRPSGGIQGLHRQRHRAIRPGRGGRAEIPQGAAGPRRRIDLSREACPSWRWPRAPSPAFPARVYRISFSGELSYEVAVPAAQGQALWDAMVMPVRRSASSPMAPRRCTSCEPRRASS